MHWMGVHGGIGWVYSMVHIKLGPPARMRVIMVDVLDFRAHLGLLDMYACGKYAA